MGVCIDKTIKAPKSYEFCQTSTARKILRGIWRHQDNFLTQHSFLKDI